MESMPDTVYALKLRIEAAEQSDDVVAVLLQLAPQFAETFPSKELASLLVDAFEALRTLTLEKVTDGERWILTYLLDYLEKDSDGTTIQKSTTRQLRECLVEWIAQYSERESMALRQRILDELLMRFRTHPSSALCWMFASLGYRDEQIVQALWNYVPQEEGERGDIALTTLTALGIRQQEKPQLLEELHRRMHRHVTQPLLIALTRLADPASVEVVRDTCFPSLTSKEDWRAHFLEVSLALGVLMRIADAHEQDEYLLDRIWQLIATLYEKESSQIASTVNLGGDIVQQCDSNQVVPTILTWLAQALDDEQKQQERNPILLYRLQECLRPRQIASWQHHQISSVIPLLQQSACQDTRFTGRSSTREMHTKEAAWGTLLCLGYAGALAWFEEGVSRETNPYLQGELCDLFACFCLDPLPDQVLSLLLKRYDVKRSASSDQVSAEISVRLGAQEVARSAPSMDVFYALLACGLTIEEQPLLASVEALTEVARSLARKGLMITIVERLVVTIAQHSRAACRLAAARTLETLTSEQEVSSSLLQPLLNVLLTQHNRDAFERSIIASTLFLQPDFVDILVPYLKQWAQERDDELARLSFSLLAQHRMLLSEDALLKQLGLHLQAQEVTLLSSFKYPDWWVQVIGLLYVSHPKPFTSLIAHFIRTLSWASAVHLFRKINTFDIDRAQGPFPHEIVVALIERVRQRQTRSVAELDLIRLMARWIPEELACEAWDLFWQDWLPNARATLADTLGTLPVLSDVAHTHRVRLLQSLMSDGHYIVRRAAYRGLQRCAAPLLQQWCWIWAVSDERPLRVRAAEAWSWLSSEDEQERTAAMLFRQLASDPEPEVRQAAQRTRQERQKRGWARIYLTNVLSVNTSTPAHTALLAAWPYAEALKRVGDDTTLQDIHTALSNQGLPPHIRHWYRRILKEMSEGWEKAMKKWPPPATMWTGTLERGEGTVSTPDATLPVHYTVWRDDAVSLEAEVSSWGGSVQGERVLEFALGALSLHQQFFLHLEDGRKGEILFKEMNEQLKGGVFVGQSHFPQ